MFTRSGLAASIQDVSPIFFLVFTHSSPQTRITVAFKNQRHSKFIVMAAIANNYASIATSTPKYRLEVCSAQTNQFEKKKVCDCKEIILKAECKMHLLYGYVLRI